MLRRSAARVLLSLLLFVAIVVLDLSPRARAATALRNPKRSNVLLITVESLRADHLGCYTGGQKSTPAIDALALKGVRFERAYAASVSSAPSVATVLTGLYPVKHGLRGDIGGRMKDDVPTLTEGLARAGYRTGAVVGSSHVDSAHGHDRGFQAFDDSIKSPHTMPGSRLRERRADEVVKKGIEFLDADKKRQPFFLWLDFYDPHYDYAPPEPLKKQFESEPYAGEVANVDTQIGVLMEGLRSRGLDRTTDVIFVGSHGEGQGDHGETGHGIYLFETTARVPFIVVPTPRGSEAASDPRGKSDESGGKAGGGADKPGESEAGGRRVVKTPVGLIDVAPTVYDLTGVASSIPLDGRSLREDILGKKAGAPQPRRFFIEASEPFLAYGWSPMFAVIEGDRKVVQGTRLEAFDLASDPGEVKPIQPTPDWAESLRTFGQPLSKQAELSGPEQKHVLDAADTLDFPWRDGPTCLEKNSFSDPRDRVDLNDRLFRARDGSDRGLDGRAFYTTLDVLQKDPGNYSALEFNAVIVLRSGTALTLMDTLEILQCNYPLRGAAYHFYGHEMEKEHKYDKAERALSVFKMLEPTIDDPYYDLACLYAGQGNTDRAVEYLAEAIKKGSRDFAFIWRDPRLTSIKKDARFTRLVGPAPALPR